MEFLWIICRCSQCSSRLLEYHHHHILWHKWESLLQTDTYWMSVEIALLHIICKDVSQAEQYDQSFRGLIILKDQCYFFFSWVFKDARLNPRARIFQISFFYHFFPPPFQLSFLFPFLIWALISLWHGLKALLQNPLKAIFPSALASSGSVRSCCLPAWVKQP